MKHIAGGTVILALIAGVLAIIDASGGWWIAYGVLAALIGIEAYRIRNTSSPRRGTWQTRTTTG